ncbi:MAG: hypothetical protein PHF45_02040 [Candidatus Pacebacteria bacterium]|nr:hypothetical protein [Candidatus Paceibacterota bacterium]
MIINKKIFSALEVEKLPESKQREIAVRLENIILDKLFVEAMGKLPSQKKKEYIKILEFGEPKDIYIFLTDNISDFEELAKKIAVEVVEKFKEELNA